MLQMSPTSVLVRYLADVTPPPGLGQEPATCWSPHRPQSGEWSEGNTFNTNNVTLLICNVRESSR